MKKKKQIKKQIKKKPMTVADILAKRKQEDEKKKIAEDKKIKVEQEREEKRSKKIAEKEKKESPKNSKNIDNSANLNSAIENMKNPSEYIAFIEFIATPKDLREIETQGEFSKKFGVGQDTLSAWKRRDGFWDDVRVIRKQIIREDYLPLALVALKRTALRDGKAPEVKLLFQLADEFVEKSEVETRKSTKLSPQRKEEIANCLKAWKGKRNGQFTTDTKQ